MPDDIWYREYLAVATKLDAVTQERDDMRAELAAEREKAGKVRLYATAPLKLEAVTAERDALRALLREVRAALKGTLGYGIDDRARRAGHAALASIDAALNKGGGDENS